MKKACTKCGVKRRKTDFYLRTGETQKRVAQCKYCYQEYTRKWGRANHTDRSKYYQTRHAALYGDAMRYRELMLYLEEVA